VNFTLNNESLIRIENVSKAYDKKIILDDISFSVEKNEFLTILGPSGCGKTTLIRIIGGFEEPEQGKVILDGRKINGISANDREVNTVFQKYSLFPHMNVFENIAFGLKIKKLSSKKIKSEVEDVLKLVDLIGFEKRSINLLSGGEQQRVAIARALVMRPKVLLLDEPLSALDRKLRQEMQRELKAIQKKSKITFIYVTHDQEEALTMSDKVIVLNDGVIQMIGNPDDIYNEPINLFVADFVGTNNIIKGKMIKDYRVSFLGKEFECVDYDFGENVDVNVIIRPEDFIVGEGGRLCGYIKEVNFKGIFNELIVECDKTEFIVQTTLQFKQGENACLDVIPFNIHVLKEERKNEKKL
jgi:spermidine/putrescine transport system ATP-binding protein